MRCALIGLQGMAGDIARRLRQQDIEVVGCDEDAELSQSLAAECGVITTSSVVAALRKLPGDSPKLVWLMLSAGDALEKEIKNLAGRLSLGDVVVDGSYSNYRESQRRAALLSQSGVWYLDAGISDGGRALEDGFCITVGGERDHVKVAEPLFSALASAEGASWSHVGLAGAGHFARMVQSSIEWGVRQAMSEGLALLQGKDSYAYDIAAIAQAWSQGGALGGELLSSEASLCVDAAELDGAKLPNYNEVRWGAIEAVDQKLNLPVLSAALHSGFRKPGE